MSENRERELEYQIEFLRDVVSVMEEWYWEVDERLVFTFCSDRIMDVLGWMPGEMVGRSPVEIFECGESRALREAFGSRLPFHRVECAVVTKSGEPVSFIFSGTPVTGPDGEFLGYRGVSRDITERRRTEKALQESEERLRVFFESAPLPYHSLDGDGRILDVNKAWLECLGYTHDEVAGRWFGDFIVPEERELFLIRFARFKEAGEARDVEWILQRKDGSTLVISISGKAEYNPDGSFRQSYCVFHDITERKRMEVALEIQHDLARDLGSARDLPESLSCILDAVLRFEEVDSGGVYLADEAGGLTLTAARGISPEFEERVRHFDADAPNVRMAVRGEPIYGHYSQYPTPNDEIGAREGLRALAVIPVLHQGRPLAVMIFASHSRDNISPQTRAALTSMAECLGGIVGRIRAEEALRENVEMWETLFNVLPVGVSVVDSRHNLLDFNRALTEIMAVTPAELRSGALSRRTFLWPDHTRMDLHDIPCYRAVLKQEFLRDVKMGVIREDGGVTWLNVSAAPLAESGAVVVTADITGYVRTEEALRASLAEKEMLLRELHHRVKNNLAAIIGLLDLQRRALGDSAEAPMLAELAGRIKSMSIIHERLYQAESLSRIDFQDYLTALASHLRMARGTRSNVRIEVNARGVELDLDVAVPCGMIVNELVTNSLKYAFPQEVPCPEGESCRIDVSMSRREENLTLVIADNGVGLPADMDWERTGTLGLRLVRMLGEHQLDGAFAVDRSGGTRFTFTFTSRERKP